MAFDTAPPSHGGPAPSLVYFERPELNRLLRLYGMMVAAGVWRDYAIDSLREAAVFSVFKRSGEVPLYRIEKRPALARRQGAWSVTNQQGMILKRGHELDNVLKVFDKTRLSLVK